MLRWTTRRSSSPAPPHRGSPLRRFNGDARPFVQAIADAEIVDPAADHAADARRDDRHPPPAVPGAEDFPAPARDRGEKARTEVTRRIDRVAGVEAIGGTDEEHKQDDDDRHETVGRR